MAAAQVQTTVGSHHTEAIFMGMRNLLAALLLLLTATTIFAQSGKVTGRVMDSSGSVMPGVQIKLYQDDKVIKQATSTSTGDFEIVANPGDYKLEVTAPDFDTYTEMVKVTPNLVPLSITMSLAQITQNVDVTETRTEISIDPDSSLQTTVLGKDFIEALPDDEDELTQYLSQIAGSRGGAGGTATFVIDGFTGGRIPPKDQIQEIRISNNPFSTEFSGIGYGRTEIITKAGTGDIHGNMNFEFRDASMNARDPFLTTRDGSPAVKPPAQTRNFQSNFSGPIIRNRLSLNLNVRHFDNENTNTIRAVIPTTDGTGQNYSAPFVSPNNNKNINARSQLAINKNNTLYVNYQNQHQQRLNQLFGGPTTLEERAANNVVRNSELQLRETSVLTKSIVHEVRFEYRRDFSQTTPHLVAQAINVLDSFNRGGGQNNSLNNNRNVELSNLLMYSGAKWTVKTGFQSLYRMTHSLQQNNFIGTFTFSSLACRPDPNNPTPIVDMSTDPACAGAFIANRPLQFTQTRGNPLLDVNQLELASFIQNDWKITKKFNLSFGARYEAQTNISAYHNVDPRMGFAYELTKTMALRGGLGIFHQRLDVGIVEGLMRLDGTRQQQIIISRSSILDQLWATQNFHLIDDIHIPISLRTRTPDLVTPYTSDASVSLEKTLPKGLGLTFSWYGSRGVHQYRSRNINAPLPVTLVNPDPDPLHGPIFQLESTGNSRSNNYSIGWQETVRNKWNVRIFGNYTLGYIRNDTDGWQSLPVNSYDIHSEWGRAGFDTRHRVFTGANWTMPWNLNLTAQMNWNSARPYNVTTGHDDNSDGVINDRPIDAVTGKMLARNTGVGAGLFNLNLNVQKTIRLKGSEKSAPGGRAGNNGPNGVNNLAPPQRGGGFPGGGFPAGGQRGPGGDGGLGGQRGGPGGNRGPNGRFNQQNTGPTMTFRAQFQNVLNDVQYGNYIGTLTSPFFGHAISTSRPPRQLELGLRLNF